MKFCDPTENESPDILLRETPAEKVRIGWSAIKQHLEHEKWIRDLNATCQSEGPKPNAKRSAFQILKDRAGVLFCYYVHPATSLRNEYSETGLFFVHNFTECPVCGRHFGLPWVEPEAVDRDVYLRPLERVLPAQRTRQAI